MHLKRYTLFLFTGLLLSTGSLLAQNCRSTPTGFADLAGNAVSARVNTGGDLWFDGQDGQYLVSEGDSLPTNQSPTVAFLGGLWLNANDPGGNVLTATQLYGRGFGNFDYGPGPLDEDGNSLSNCGDWDQVWSINRESVDRFLASFDPANPDPAAIPADVLGWPALGNPHFADLSGFSLPDRPEALAPFNDANNDGRYDPYDGDHPQFCGERALWCVFNDAVLHRQSGTVRSMHAEVQLLAYSFDADNDDPIQRTTFYDYRVTNFGMEDYQEFYAGFWLDLEVGCFIDDELDSVPSENTVYFYNAQPMDSDPCPSGFRSFQTEGVVQIAQLFGAPAGPAVDSAGTNFPANQYLLNVEHSNLAPRTSLAFTLVMTTLLNVPYEGDAPELTPILNAIREVRHFQEMQCEALVSIDRREGREMPSDPIRVFPNPTNGVVTLQSTDGSPLGRVELYDGAGRLLLRRNTPLSKLTLDLVSEELPSGVYIYRCTDGAGSVGTGRIVLR